MAKMKIEKDVPVPVRKKRTAWMETMKSMKHGDSILLESRKDATRFFQAARNLEGYGTEKKFTSRVQEDGTVRVWAIDLTK